MQLLCCYHIDFVTRTLPPCCRQYCCSPFPPKVAHISLGRTTKVRELEALRAGGRDSVLPICIFSFSVLILFFIVSILSSRSHLPNKSAFIYSVYFIFYSVLRSVSVFVIYVTLTSRSASGHLRYRSRCVESDCGISLPSVKFFQQPPFSSMGVHCFRIHVEVNVLTKDPSTLRDIQKIRKEKQRGFSRNRFTRSRYNVM